LLGRALIVDGGSQIVDIGGVPVGVNVPEGKYKLRRERNKCDPSESAMPPERPHDCPHLDVII
jgi:hypothetical protein